MTRHTKPPQDEVDPLLSVGTRLVDVRCRKKPWKLTGSGGNTVCVGGALICSHSDFRAPLSALLLSWCHRRVLNRLSSFSASCFILKVSSTCVFSCVMLPVFVLCSPRGPPAISLNTSEVMLRYGRLTECDLTTVSQLLRVSPSHCHDKAEQPSEQLKTCRM